MQQNVSKKSMFFTIFETYTKFFVKIFALVYLYESAQCANTWLSSFLGTFSFLKLSSTIVNFHSIKNGIEFCQKFIDNIQAAKLRCMRSYDVT